MNFKQLLIDDDAAVSMMSKTATEIVKEHYDPIVGAVQNDYMIEMFQSVPAIRKQLQKGYQYYFVLEDTNILGFLAFYPNGDSLYLSKLYLYKDQRKKGYSHGMLNFVVSEAKKQGLSAIELNVNKNNDAVYVYEKLGFQRVRSEKNDIGNGYFMDDFVYRLTV